MSARLPLALALAALATVLLAAPARAQFLHWLTQEKEPPALVETPPEAQPAEDLSAFDRYLRFWDREIEKILGMDLYGVTSQLPRGYLSVKWQWDMIKAGNRYNDKRKLGPVFPPIGFDLNGEEQLAVDLDLSGQGGGHTFQISYGITDPIDFYFEIPFTYMDLSFNANALPIDDDGNTIGPAAAALLGVSDRKAYSGTDFFLSTLRKLGRPTPGTRAKGEWLLGDINTGFSWNIFRTPRFSGALTMRVFLPTGRVPDPNRSLTYATGPELEVGLGGWAVGFTQGYDVRIFRHSWWLDVILSTEFTASYGFEQHRKYPTNFVAPDPVAAGLDPVSFPDLSHLGTPGFESFSYTPGWGVDWIAKIGMMLFGVSFEAGFGVMHSQTPELNADPAFTSMVKGLELLGSQTTWAVQLGAGISLAPLYVPVDIAFAWRKVVDGTNAIVFDDYYQIVVKGYLPILPLFD